MKNASLIPGMVMVVMLVACGQQTGGKTTQTSSAVQSADELALLAFVNDQANVTFEVLDDDCSLRSDAARKIIKHRDGNDQTPGTADDNLFDTVDELDGVSMVGPAALEALAACADSLGYQLTNEEIALVNFLNDSYTDFNRLDIDCGLRSNAAQNLISHRNGPDGQLGTTDDNLFHSAEEVDSISQVGDAAMEKLYDCADAFGFTVEVWTPEIPVITVEATHPDVITWVEDGIIYMDPNGAPYGSEVNITFDGHEDGFNSYWYGFNAGGIGSHLPPGYGGEELPAVDGVQRVRITRDPVGTITKEQGLEIARRDLIVFLQEERMARQDWQLQLSSFVTWEACIGEGILEDIARFGTDDPNLDSGFTSTPTHYEFSGRGPLGLWTRIIVSKADEEGTYFYVEID